MQNHQQCCQLPTAERFSGVDKLKTVHLTPQTASWRLLYMRATLPSPPLTLLQVGSILINLGTVCGVIERGTDQKSSCAPVLKRLLITECHEAGPQQALSRFAREQQAPYQVLFCYYTSATSNLAAHNTNMYLVQEVQRVAVRC